MVRLVSTACAVLGLSTAALSAPAPQGGDGSWKDWMFYTNGQSCTKQNMKTRQDFDTMQPADRKAYTDAINCLRTKPSQLDQSQYPAAINRYFDWAVVHVNKTRVAHLDGFFLVWHRMFLHLFEEDLRNQCGFDGIFPYWNWPATADDLEGSKIFDGSEYSMSSNGYFTNDEPYQLSPQFSIPHGSGGGCIMSGPFQGMNYTMPPVNNGFLLNGTAPPHSIFDKHESCLTRDLNTFAAQTWLNYTAVQVAVESPDLASFETALNGVFGGGALGIHSGAHFTVGPPASNIFVSAQDPIWYPLHTMLDRTYVSWQKRHPDQAYAVWGTETANNAPPSPNVTLDTIVPDWGYFGGSQQYTIGQLSSTMAGPFCYNYDSLI